MSKKLLTTKTVGHRIYERQEVLFCWRKAK